MQKSNFELEKKLYKEGYDWVVGIDEAGRGPLAGPVVAAAASPRNLQFIISNLEKENKNPNYKSKDIPSVLWTSSPPQSCNRKQQRGGEEWELIRDSKTLSEKQREKIYDFIIKKFFIGVGICDHKTIDRINILQASFLAMKMAMTNLISNIKSENKKYIILIDGNKKIPNFSGEQTAIPRGDKKIKSISTASIIAKVTRDRIMREAHKKYPRYGFDRHKGYGTKIHMEALRKFGPCKIHRRSFKPIEKMLGNKNSAG